MREICEFRCFSQSDATVFNNRLSLFVCIKTHIKKCIELSRGVFLWKDLFAIAKVSAQSMEFQAIDKESFSSTFIEDSFFLHR